MKITDEAKQILNNMLIANQCNCLEITTIKSCCGTNLNVGMRQMTMNDMPDHINEIPVIMDMRTRRRAEKVTITVANNQLTLQDEGKSNCC